MSIEDFWGGKPAQPLTTRELMDRERRWVGWKIELRNGDPNKEPIDPASGYHAKSNDPSTWGRLADARRAVAKHALAGPGFMLGDGWGGADIDGPPEWKKTPPADADERQARRAQIWERKIGDREVGAWVHLIGGYAEFSPNDGIKIFVHGLPREGEDPHKNEKDSPDGGLEVYFEKRYFTVTGQTIIDRADADLDAFRALAACRPRRGGANGPQPARSSGSTLYGEAAPGCRR